jgi:beta-N-acetylhexosaminidase
MPDTKKKRSKWLSATVIIAALILVTALVVKNIPYHKNPSSNLPSKGSNSSNPPPPKDKIQEELDKMDIDEKIGQMVIGGYDNMDEILPIIREYKPGGVILYKKNITGVSQATKDIQSMKDSNSANKVPLFISVDQEGGRVSRLPAEMGTFESALSIGNRNDAAYAFNNGVQIGKALKQLGFNLDFAPVLDIYSNPKNTVIADRAYGTTPERVSKIGIEVLKGLRSQDIIPTAKHFPGHGDTEIDSHVGLPVVKKSVAELSNFEFKPFVEAIQNNVEMIMVAHILLSQVDDLPSSLSYQVVTNILRKQLGFKGVIITDDITMAAISKNYTTADAAVKSVNAGCDIILVAGKAQDSVLVFIALKSAWQNGQLTDQRIDESVYRILSLKNKYGLKD